MLQELQNQAIERTNGARRAIADGASRGLENARRGVEELPVRFKELTGRQQATVIGAAAASAALATGAGLVLARKLRQRRRADEQPRRTLLRLEPEGESWRLRDGGAVDSLYENKEEALDSARDMARESAPSELVIHLSSGEEQTRHRYDPS